MPCAVMLLAAVLVNAVVTVMIVRLALKALVTPTTSGVLSKLAPSVPHPFGGST